MRKGFANRVWARKFVFCEISYYALPKPVKIVLVNAPSKQVLQARFPSNSQIHSYPFTYFLFGYKDKYNISKTPAEAVKQQEAECRLKSGQSGSHTKKPGAWSV